MPGPGSVAVPKPARGTVKRLHAREDRQESKVEQQVRALVVARDGDCRLVGVTLCRGESELAHLEDSRRCFTRGMKAEQRHTTGNTAMLCTLHHRAYDAHRIQLLHWSKDLADGDLTWDVPGFGVHVERKPR